MGNRDGNSRNNQEEMVELKNTNRNQCNKRCKKTTTSFIVSQKVKHIPTYKSRHFSFLGIYSERKHFL